MAATAKGVKRDPPSGGKPHAPAQRVEVGARIIEIRGGPDADQALWIDGVRRQFFVTSAGYHLLDDAYRPAEATLLEAARKYVERQAEFGPEKSK